MEFHPKKCQVLSTTRNSKADKERLRFTWPSSRTCHKSEIPGSSNDDRHALEQAHSQWTTKANRQLGSRPWWTQPETLLTAIENHAFLLKWSNLCIACGSERFLNIFQNVLFWATPTLNKNKWRSAPIGRRKKAAAGAVNAREYSWRPTSHAPQVRDPKIRFPNDYGYG